MRRTTAPDHSSNMFVDRDMPTTPGTELDEDWHNDVQENIVNANVDMGMPLLTDASLQSVAQLSQAVQAAVARVALGNPSHVTDGNNNLDVIWDSQNELYIACTAVPDFETSPDATAWTNRAPSGGTGDANALATDHGGLIIAVGDGGDAWTSADAVTFTLRATGAGNLEDIAYDGSSLFVATGTNIVSHYSTTDGITWTARAKATGTTYNGIGHGGGLWVAVGDAGAIETSPDGITWTSRTSGVAVALNSVAYSANGRGTGLGLWCAVGEDGTIITSPDGITWSTVTLLAATTTTDDLYVVRHLGDRVGWVVGGNLGRVHHGAHPAALREIYAMEASGANDVQGIAGPPNYRIGPVVFARQSNTLSYSQAV